MNASYRRLLAFNTSTSTVRSVPSDPGNDAAAGTPAAPWKTIDHAAQVAAAGDTALVRGGKYREYVTVACCGGDIRGLFDIESRNWVTICGFEIRDVKSSSNAEEPAGIEAASKVKGHAASAVTIRDNLVHDTGLVDISMGGYASDVGGSDSITIVNNTLAQSATAQGNGFPGPVLTCARSPRPGCAGPRPC